MNRKKYITITVVAVMVAISIYGCLAKKCPPKGVAKEHFDTIKHRHFNILIVPDLSNRIKNPMSQNDVSIVQKFASMMYPEIINNKKLIDQRDIFRIDLIDKMGKGPSTFKIDLNRFGKKHLERNLYLGIFESTSQFKKDTAAFARHLDTAIVKAKCKPVGADIYSYLDNLNSLQIDTTIRDEVDSVTHKVIHNYYDNIIVLLTDGYIETSTKYPDGYVFPEKKADDFRKKYQLGKYTDPDNFLQSHTSYKIIPVKNNLLKHTRILLLQLYDRGSVPGGNKHPELTDIRIIKTVWQDWLVNSGVKRENIEMHSCEDTNNESNIEYIFRHFLKLGA